MPERVLLYRETRMAKRKDAWQAGQTADLIPEWAHKLMRDRYGMKLHG